MPTMLFPLATASLALLLSAAHSQTSLPHAADLPFPAHVLPEASSAPDSPRVPRSPSAAALTLGADLDAQRGLAALDRVVLRQLPLPGRESVDVELTRIDLEAMRFRFHVDGIPRSDLLQNLDLSVWKGRALGFPNSEIRMAFSTTGMLGSLRLAEERYHFLPRERPDGGWFACETLVATEEHASLAEPSERSRCHAEHLYEYQEELSVAPALHDPADLGSAHGSVAHLGAGSDLCNLRECTIAIETDYQLYQKFNDLAAETAYVTTLLAHVSNLYQEEIGTLLSFPYVMFYTDAADPWNAQDSPATPSQVLLEFRGAWTGNIPQDARLGHFLSGAPLGGGLAYLNSLHRPAFAFGVSGGVNGLTSFPLVQQPMNWDFVVLSHELGHNFNAPHTHQFCPPIDDCAPSGSQGPCQDQTQCNPNGTLMSYCHLCLGGTANITNSFHAGPATRMRNASQAWLPVLSEGALRVDWEPVAYTDGTTPVRAYAEPASAVSDVTLQWRRDAGAFVGVPMVDLGGGAYEAHLPPPLCDRTVEYFVSYQDPDCGLRQVPANAPDNLLSAAAGVPTYQFVDDFELDNNWTVESEPGVDGVWERGDPLGLPDWPYAPDDDLTGGGQCYLTRNGPMGTDVDGGATRLVSPPFDSTAEGFMISYGYHLFLQSQAAGDRLLLEWSAHGDQGPWIEIAEHVDPDADWQTQVLTHAELVERGAVFSPLTKIRFSAIDAGANTIVEAAVDEVRFGSLSCDAGSVQSYCTASPNSASAGAVISSIGSLRQFDNNFMLVTGAGVPGAPGIFYWGDQQLQAPFGDGYRCVGGATQRLFPFVVFNDIGAAFRPLDFTNAPAGVGPNRLIPGRTYYFQHWYRDQAAGESGFNLSNGLTVTFEP